MIGTQWVGQLLLVMEEEMRRQDLCVWRWERGTLVRAEVQRQESKEQVREMGSSPICLNRKIEGKV